MRGLENFILIFVIGGSFIGAVIMWVRRKYRDYADYKRDKADRDEAQDWANVPHTDDDFHDRMHKRIKRKD